MNYKKLNILICTLLVFSSALLAQNVFVEQGTRLIKNEKYNEAKRYFQSPPAKQSQAESNFYLGEIYFLQGKVDSAAIFYQNGMQSDKELPYNYAGMVKVNVAKNNLAEASKLQEQALDIDDDLNSQVYVILADAYSGAVNTNYDKAIELLNEAISENSKNTNAHIALGNIYLKRGNGTEAIKSFQKAIDLNPTNSEALTQKARVYVLSHNDDYALTLLNEVSKSDSSYAPVFYELAELSADMNNYADASRYYNKYMTLTEVTQEMEKRYASILYLNKEYQPAIDILGDIIPLEPKNPAPLRITAYSYLRMDSIQSSLSFFQKLFEMDSVEFLSSDYENYADLLTKTGNDSLAIVYLLKVADMDSTRNDVLNKASVLYFKARNWSGVISTLNRKSELTAQELFDLGKAYYFAKDSVNADTTFAMLIESKPTLAIAYHWRARIKSIFDPESEQGLAQPFYEQFITLSAEDTTKYKRELLEAYSYLGYYYYIKNDMPNSRLYWQKVAAIDPTNEQAQLALKEIK